MAKMTRKSYRRKKIILGVSLFASVALISTGFAAWVLASQAEATAEGNVTVGTVTDSSIKIENVHLSANSFLFEPKESDTTGRVRNDDTNFENLTITVTGDITPATYVSEATIQLEVPEGVKTAAGDTKNYIVLPTCVAAPQELTLVAGEGDTKTFSYDITFAWGSAFNGLNPGEYYDDDETGKAVADATLKSTLEDLRTCMYGEGVETSPKFNVTIKAMN